MAPDAPPEISAKMIKGLQPADYSRIKAPTLAILNGMSPQYRMPYFWSLDRGRQQQFASAIKSLSKWIDGPIERI